MARIERLALLACGAAAVVACNLIAGIDQFHDVPCEPCEAGSVLEGGPIDDGSVDAPIGDGGIDATIDAGDAADADATAVDAADAADAADATDAGSDGSDADATLPEASVDYTWARWLMPNGAEAGLPNPARYAPAPGIDGGVLDLVTGLTWANAQNVNSALAAVAACPPPFRVPTRIELVTILDTSQSSVLVNPAFTQVQAGTYWTSSRTLEDASWTIDFRYGYVRTTMNGTAVICVQSDAGSGP
jgi:hypothetical protein